MRHDDLGLLLREKLREKPLLLMTHLIVGYPSLEDNWSMLEEMARAGVDVVELQMPFSEPIADGPLFVLANHSAIAAGVTWRDYFSLAYRASSELGLNILFMGYYNSVFKMGINDFCQNLSDANMQGFIIPDLPIEESKEFRDVSSGRGISMIPIMAPGGSDSRLSTIGQSAASFVYCAARAGVTGRPTDVASDDVAEFIVRCRLATSALLGLGFGISTSQDVRALHGVVDMAIVGTAGLKAWQTGGVNGYRYLLSSLVQATEME